MSASHRSGGFKRYYTAEEANKALPLVRMIVADAVKQIQAVETLQHRLSGVSSGKKGADDPYAEEVAQTLAELESENDRLRELLDELGKLGVELKGPDGLCDFPSLRDGREVYLCWRLGEPSVAHWHELDAGFAGRQVLEAPAAENPPLKPIKV